MSSYYGLIVSEYRHYDYEKQHNKAMITKLLPTTNSILSQYDSSPPSYSAVLAEKYQQQQQQQCATWDQKLSEMNDMLRSMKQSIIDTQIIIKSFQYCCQKLKFKNQSLLTELQQKIHSISEMNADDITTFDNSKGQPENVFQRNTNDSLTRMNLSLEKLIEEAEMSLNTRLSLHADPHLLRRSRSCPRFTTKRNISSRRNSSSSLVDTEKNDEVHESEHQLQLQQQKRRYFHSQWRLAIAMKQLVQTVQSTTHQSKESNSQNLSSNTTKEIRVVHHHIHHYYHHIYHHYDNKSLEEGKRELPTTPVAPIITPEFTEPPEIISAVTPNKSQEIQFNPVSNSGNMMRRESSSLSSLFKYALHTTATVAGFIPEETSQLQLPTLKSVTMKRISSNPVKIQAMFVATVLVLRKFNKTPKWINRGNYLVSRWNRISKQQCNLWIKNSNLLLFIIQLVAHHIK